MISGRHRAGVLALAALLAARLLFPTSSLAQGAAPPSPAGAPAPPTAERSPDANPEPATGTPPPATVRASAAPTGPAAGAEARSGAPVAAPGRALSGMSSLLPDDFSLTGMFLHADIVVKIVISGLLLASVLTWTVGLAKTIELMAVKRRLRRACRVLRDAGSLAVAADNLSSGSGIARMLVQEGRDEWQRSVHALDDRDGLKERIALRLERLEALAGRNMLAGTGVLATIGSTAPFVGLFGTVWGIMNSFIGISKMHTTNLAVVAPGIAEALLATACGLIAAIPAVVIYNHFARQIAGYKALVANAASAVIVLVSRDLSHGGPSAGNAVAAEARRAPAEPQEGKASLRLIAE